ncbi:C39 family peptidase [Nitrosophilus kaiyonis]|uniref:C39 family peptidase n=1 Tax=Nitrosophilus kaiyonis TaxID=2930200 RepID=UPI00248FB8BA|nr:C39 family peptidase [Nitrosophilus kaiyonis]
MREFLKAIIILFFIINIGNAENKKLKHATVPVYINTGFGSIMIRPKVKSQDEIKSKNVIKQKFDFSCGSATCATLFNFYLNDPISEKEAVEGLFKYGNKRNIIKNRGFSLLDIKKFANAKGYKVLGYKTDIEGLVELGKPAIVAIVLGKYKHFVVFRGVYKGRVFLADPALGNTIVSISEFKKIWFRNIALIIEPKSKKIDNKLKISKEDEIMVNSEKLRSLLLNQQIQMFRSPKEF